MKRLLLASFLLTSGMITSEIVVANAPTTQSELKKAPQPPIAVLQAFAAAVAQFEANGYTTVIDVTWSFNKGKFTATFYFQYDNGMVEGPFSATFNRQGERV